MSDPKGTGLSSQNHNQGDQNETQWMLVTLSRATGALAGLVAIISGLLSLVTVSSSCFFAGALLILEGFIMSLTEAPCFCIFLDFSHVPSQFFEDKPHYFKAAAYLIFGVLPITFCAGFFIFLSSGLMIMTSGLYLMRSLGRKASREEMAANAATVLPPPSSVVLDQSGNFVTTETKIPVQESGLKGDLPPPPYTE